MSEPNPFEDDANAGTVLTEENPTNSFDADVEDVPVTEPDAEVDTVPASTTTSGGETKPAKKAASSRPEVPAGYITPVQFAHKLTDKLRGENKLAEGEVFPPQMVYSWVKAGKNANAQNGLKSYTEGGRENLLKEDEAWEWYNNKEARKAAREEEKAKKAAQPEKAPTEAEAAPSEPVTEVE
jgi:hypothetical protein